jgi:hypothetical protein
LRPSASSLRDASRATRSDGFCSATSLAMTAGALAPEYAYLDYTDNHGGLPFGPVAVC